MTEDDISFIRGQWQWAMINFLVESPNAKANTKRLLNLLVEAEVRGDKAEFYKIHDEDPEDCEYCGDTSCDGSGHFYDDSDWQKAVRERWGLE